MAAKTLDIYICITDLAVLCVIVIIDSSKLYLASLYANTLLPLKSREWLAKFVIINKSQKRQNGLDSIKGL